MYGALGAPGVYGAVWGHQGVYWGLAGTLGTHGPEGYWGIRGLLGVGANWGCQGCIGG